MFEKSPHNAGNPRSMGVLNLLIQFAQYDLKAGLTPLLPASAIALLTVAVNFVVDWFLHKTSGLRDE